MTAEIKRIGRWTTHVALDEARANLGDEDALLIVAIGKEDQMMKYWAANVNNMQVNWMADNVKADVMFEGRQQ